MSLTLSVRFLSEWTTTRPNWTAAAFQNKSTAKAGFTHKSADLKRVCRILYIWSLASADRMWQWVIRCHDRTTRTRFDDTDVEELPTETGPQRHQFLGWTGTRFWARPSAQISTENAPKSCGKPLKKCGSCITKPKCIFGFVLLFKIKFQSILVADSRLSSVS